VRLPGFEPGLEAWEAKKGTLIGKTERILKSFEEFCLVDLKLKQGSADNHIRNIRRLLLGTLDKPLSQIDVQDLRTYLKGYLNKANGTYANQIKALRVFFRDFLKSGYLVESFKLPNNGYIPKIIPSKKKVQQFYSALESLRDKTLFLMFATTGLRKAEVLSLTLEDLDMERRMVIPKNHRGNKGTKRSWISFYNDEVEEALKKYLAGKNNHNLTIFDLSIKTNLKNWKKASKKIGFQITPQVLRDWFCCEMGRLSVPDRYVDAFCGRTPKSVLSRHYTDYSPEH